MKEKLFKVNVPVADLWSKPAFNSSRLSQALFGEVLEILRNRQGYHYVKTPDQYLGWVNGDHIQPVADESMQSSTAIVQKSVANVYNSAGLSAFAGRLSFGTHVEYDEISHGTVRIAGGRGWMNQDDLLMRFPAKNSSAAIIKTLSLFIGVPYLWGGKSGFGLDCSGFIQLVYGFHGVVLPRDSKDQAKMGARVLRGKMRKGDLIFMPGHAAVYIGAGKIIHSSLKAGGVKIESIEKSSHLYRPDIAKRITQIRRVL